MFRDLLTRQSEGYNIGPLLAASGSLATIHTCLEPSILMQDEFDRHALRAQRFYQESGVVPFWSVHITLLAGLLAGIVSAPVLVFLGALLFIATTFFCMLVFVAVPLYFFLPLIHGYIVCLAVSKTANRCAIRNQTFVTWICVICLPFAFYFMIYLLTWPVIDSGFQNITSPLDPIALWEVISQWLADKSTLQKVLLYGGTFLTFCMYFLALGLLVDMQVPYCEDCRRLCKTHKRETYFLRLRPSWLRQGNFQNLVSRVQPRHETRVLKARFYYCPHCLQSCYVRIYRVTRKQDKKNPEQYEEDPQLIYNLLCVPVEWRESFDIPGPPHSMAGLREAH